MFAAALLAVAACPTSGGLGATSLPTFGQPTISGIQAFGFEQGIRLDPTNPSRVYTSVPGSGNTDTSWIWHSEDGGKTFKWVTASAPTSGKPTTCHGGGDTELAVDTAGHLYFADLTLANFSTARSDDGGATFTCSNTGVPDAVVDRQWYATDGDPTNGGSIYLASDEVGQGNPSCNTSSVGNNVLVMFRSPLAGVGSTAGVTFGPANEITQKIACGEGIMGNDEVSPVATTTGLNGAQLSTPVRHVYVIHDDATLTKILVARCFPVAFGLPVANVADPSGLNCVDLPVASFPGSKTGANFPTMAIDRAGNLYAVWEQAPVNGSGFVTGDTVLRYAYSTDEGNHWSTPMTIPTPGLHNNVLAWPAAGDDGRVDIAWYGTPATANPNDPTCGHNGSPTPPAAALGGPDSTTNGIWSVYMVQTLNGHAAAPTFTAPILAGEHYAHKGTIQTIIGGQCGDRTLGDFLQMRVGSHGEAQIAYADSNNILKPFLISHGMYVRQNGGSGLYSAGSPVSGDPILLNGASDPSGDGRFEAAGQTSPNIGNLDVTGSSMAKPTPSDCHPSGTPCYRVSMTVADLTSLGPPATSGDTDTDLVWLTQWLVPAATDCTDFSSTESACATGGKNFFVYAEANNGQLVGCFSGETSGVQTGLNPPTYTYPGQTPLADPGACSVSQGQPGTITIDVPISQVSLPAGTAPFSNTLYSVTASTMTLAAQANSAGPDPFLHQGGLPFNLIDVVRAYDASFVPPPTLTLAPKSQTLVVRKDACVTATVASGAGPASGVVVRFSVSGANAATGSNSTNPSGVATFCYEGRKTGLDTVAAFADLNKNRSPDAGEPGDTASVTWTSRHS